MTAQEVTSTKAEQRRHVGGPWPVAPWLCGCRFWPAAKPACPARRQSWAVSMLLGWFSSPGEGRACSCGLSNPRPGLTLRSPCQNTLAAGGQWLGDERDAPPSSLGKTAHLLSCHTPVCRVLARAVSPSGRRRRHLPSPGHQQASAQLEAEAGSQPRQSWETSATCGDHLHTAGAAAQG